MEWKLLRWVLKLPGGSWQMSTARVFHSRVALGKKVCHYLINNNNNNNDRLTAFDPGQPG